MVHIIGQAGNQGRRAELIHLGVGEGIDVAKQLVPQLRAESLGGDGGEILTHQRRAQAHHAQQKQQSAHSPDIGAVVVLYADVNNISHHQGYDQLKNRLDQLKNRAGDDLLLIGL